VLNFRGDKSQFPDPVYKETVLRPLFDGAKTHYIDGFRSIDRAHLVMLHECGIINADIAKKIAGALHDIDRTIEPTKLVYTGEVEDFFFLIERELKNRIGVDIAGFLHTARSRNDIDHTLFKIELKAKIDKFLAQAHHLLAAMVIAAERHQTTLIVAYTHGQPAQPSTFGHYLGAAIEVLIRDIERLWQARKIVDLCPMGACAITTSGFPIDRARMAELLGFCAPLPNSYSCIAAVDYITATYSAIELLFLHLGRLIQDFQVWSSFEVGQIYVPNSFVQISSIMPQKRNPVAIEHLRHLASQAGARARAVRDIVHNTPFTDMNDSETETQMMGYEAFHAGERVFELLTALISQISIDEDRVRENIERSCITITELADSLVREEELSFRQAHEIAAEVAREITASKSNFITQGYPVLCEAFQHNTGRKTALNEEQFKIIVSAENFIAVRTRFGGPASQPMYQALESYQQKCAEFDRLADKVTAYEADKATELKEKFLALIGQ